MRSKDQKILLDELPKMVDAGLISPEQSARISEHYGSIKTGKSGIALVAFSIIGSVLLAAGIILILAHNWSNLSRLVRTIIAFAPLVAAQAIGFWVLRKRLSSTAWTEGISAFAFLSVGATIALISQIYHIKGGIESYVLTWMLLSVPLVYVFKSITGAVLYIAGITAWAIAERVSGGAASGYWLLFIIIVPIYYLSIKQSLTGIAASILGWFVALSVACGGTLATGSISESSWVLVLIGLLLSLFSLGVIFYLGDEPVWKSPLYRIGTLGLVVTYIVLSYRGIWEFLSFTQKSGATISSYIGTCAIGAATIALALLAIRKNPVTASLIAAGLPLAVLGFFISENHIVPALLFSVYAFALGVIYMLQGLQSASGKTLNFGFLLVAASVILRFFDSDWSFTVRGIAFAVLGIGFLVTNVFVARRKGART